MSSAATACYLLGALAALCFVAAIYFGGRERSYMEEMGNLRTQMRQQNIELTRLTEIMTIMNGANMRQVNFGAGPKGKVFVNPSSGVVLMATNLPPAPAGKAYEMWVIPKSGETRARRHVPISDRMGRRRTFTTGADRHRIAGRHCRDARRRRRGSTTDSTP